MGNVKAVVSEVSDDSNQAFGLSLVGASWGLGIIIGPAVSGVVSDPIGQYNLTIDSKKQSCMHITYHVVSDHWIQSIQK